MKRDTKIWLAALGAWGAIGGTVAIGTFASKKRASYRAQADVEAAALTRWVTEGFPDSRDAFTRERLSHLEMLLERSDDPAHARELESLNMLKPWLLRIFRGEDPAEAARAEGMSL